MTDYIMTARAKGCLRGQNGEIWRFIDKEHDEQYLSLDESSRIQFMYGMLEGMALYMAKQQKGQDHETN